MVLFGAKKKVCGYDIIREGEEVILYVYCDECTYSPSIEDNPVCMARTIEKIVEAGTVSKIIFSFFVVIQSVQFQLNEIYSYT